MKKQISIASIKLPTNSSHTKRAVFLDRDGTINYDEGYTYKFSKFKFRPFVIKGLKYLSKKNYYIFIVTNQAGIAKGKFKMSDLLLLNRKLKKSKKIKAYNDKLAFQDLSTLNKNRKKITLHGNKIKPFKRSDGLIRFKDK